MVEAAAVALALVLVPLTGGSFRRLARLHFESAWLLFAGLAIQVALEVVTLPRERLDDVGFALLLGSYVLILGFAMVNLRITGMSVVAIGIACNVLVIGLNQGMPYRAPVDAPFETTVKHRPERPGDVLKVLDDRIVLPNPIAESVSFGDLILAVGIVDLVFRASRRTRRERLGRRTPGHRDETTPRPVAAVEPIEPVAPRSVDLVAAESAESVESPGAEEEPGRADASRTAQGEWPRRAPWWSHHPTLRRLPQPTPPPGRVSVDHGGGARSRRHNAK